MEKRTFLFYDIETSGLNKCFDQVLQFAAIRTDLDFNELERHEIFVRLSPDTIPSPQAILTHQISIQQMLSTGIPEVEAIYEIHQLLNTPGTISLGYNTLEFDDKFLRFSFYRNLLTPYTHQFGYCSRADLFPFVIQLFLYQKNSLNWPIINNKPSFKLEHLNATNQFFNGQAHNAIVDVEITLALAKKIFHDKKLLPYFLRCFNKEAVSKNIYKYTKEQNGVAILMNSIFGQEDQYQSLALHLGQHNLYKNQHVWLSLDRQDIETLDTENMASNVKCIYQKLGEKYLLLPSTKQYLENLSTEKKNRVQKNKQYLEKNYHILQKIKDYHLNFIYPKIPLIDTSAALYQNGFLSPEDLHICQQFHQTKPAFKYQWIKKFKKKYLQELAIRLIGRNYPQYLDSEYQEKYDNYLSGIVSKENVVDYRGQIRHTPQKVLLETLQLKNSQLTEKQLTLLEELGNYIQNNFSFSSCNYI